MTLKYIVIEEIYLLYYIALKIVKHVIKYYLNNIIKYNFRCISTFHVFNINYQDKITYYSNKLDNYWKVNGQ